jgi:hypothetical protein
MAERPGFESRLRLGLVVGLIQPPLHCIESGAFSGGTTVEV